MNRHPARFHWSGSCHRRSDSQRFDLTYGSVSKGRKTQDFFSEALSLALQIEQEAKGMPLYVCVSGGIDGEVVCRSFLQAGISFTPVVFEYKKHNRQDLSLLKSFIQSKGLQLKIIPFDEELFVKNELPQWCERYTISEPFIAFDMARIERLDGAVVFGCGDLILQDSSAGIVSLERGALFQVYEYMQTEKRVGCYQFFQGSAEIMWSFLNDPIMKKWLELQPRMQFKDSRQFKSYLYKKIWPDIELRKKWTGYERFAILYLTAQAELQKKFPIQDDCNILLQDLKKQLAGNPAEIYSEISGPL